MQQIGKVAVLGSGVMGSGIAALLANAGVPVVMLDIVLPDKDRNFLCTSAVEKQLKSNPSGFTHKNNAKLITCGNLEDNLDLLKDCDWVIEVVKEDLKIKHDIYTKILPFLKEGAAVSSNTSTLPLHVLVGGMPEKFQKHFLITHFFNPPRFLPLLEITGGKTCDPVILEKIADFADKRLGKGVVHCKDTPGFLANRIGVFWMMVSLYEAIKMEIPVEDADAVMSKPVGIPKTAVFGLFDLIGIDLMPLIAKAMLQTLPKDDRFRGLYHEPEQITRMIKDGYTGRKGKGGFYRMNKEGGKKVKEVLNLKTGEYKPEKESKLESVAGAKAGLAALVNHKDIGGQYARKVLVHSLHYPASLIPEISDDILNIDEAMKQGYAWKYGPFELIDRLGTKEKPGSDWLIEQCETEGLPVPEILKKAKGKTFYKEEGATRFYLTLAGEYKPIEIPEGTWLLKDKTRGAKPVAKNSSSALWDLGDGILGFELTGKGNTIDPDVLSMLNRTHDEVKKGFRGLVIGHDGQHFSFGANLGFFMYVANLAAWPTLSEVIKNGQNTFMGLKYAPFPVVVSLAGMGLGGGCEITLHADAVQAHIESYPGLVEVGVGVVPGWGGCKEMLMRHAALQDKVKAQVMSGKKPSAPMPQGPMPVVAKVFEYIAMAKVAGSAQEALDMLILNEKSGISMNRCRVLADAKTLCLSLAKDYVPPVQRTIRLPGAGGKGALMMALDNFNAQGKTTPHDRVVGEALASVLSGGDTDITVELTEQNLLDLEHDYFIELVKTKGTLDRIEHMLKTSKPLRN